MKRRKFLLAWAMLISALSFGADVLAQTTSVSPVPVYITYNSSNVRPRFDLYLHDEEKQDGYELQTILAPLDDYNTYKLGYVPPGKYSVYIKVRDSDWGYFNWSSRGQSGNGVLWQYGFNEYKLLDNVIVDDGTAEGNYGLNITVEDW